MGTLEGVKGAATARRIRVTTPKGKGPAAARPNTQGLNLFPPLEDQKVGRPATVLGRLGGERNSRNLGKRDRLTKDGCGMGDTPQQKRGPGGAKVSGANPKGLRREKPKPPRAIVVGPSLCAKKIHFTSIVGKEGSNKLRGGFQRKGMGRAEKGLGRGFGEKSKPKVVCGGTKRNQITQAPKEILRETKTINWVGEMMGESTKCRGVCHT